MQYMMKACEKHRRPIVTAVLLAAVLFVSLMTQNPFRVMAEDTDAGYSLFEKSAAISNAMEQGWIDTIKGNKTDKDWDIAARVYEGKGHKDAGNGGAYMGFAQDTDGLIVSAFKSMTTQNNQTVGYDSVKGAMYGYSMYGYILTHLNLYETNAGAGFDFNRTILGNALKIVYDLYQAVPFVFGMVANFMKATNPFALFMIPINGVVAVGKGSPLYPMAEYVKLLYDAVQELGIFVVLPVMIALAAFTALLSKNMGAVKNKFFKIVIRTGIIAIGVPLIGSFYTSALNSMSDISIGDGGASKVVATTLFDFESWAKNQRLSPPDGITWTGTPRTGSFEYKGKSAQNIALEVNGWNGIGPGGNGSEPDGGSMGLGDTVSQPKDGAVESMLDRYASGAIFNASDYESLVKHEMQEDTTRASGSEDLLVNKMISANGSDFTSGSLGINPLYSEADTTIYNNGGIAMDMDSDTRSAYETKTRNGSSYMRYSTRGGLSTLSIHTLLNTEFTEGGIVTYAPAKSTSLYTKGNPMSVTAVGTGLGSTLNLLNTISQITVIALLGIVYGLGMMFSHLKQGFAVIASIPATLMGSLQGFAKMLKTVVVMLTNVFFTMVFYLLMTELAMAIGGVFAEILNTTAFHETMGYNLIWIVQPIFSIALHIFVLWFGIKNRKKFLKGMGEIMQGLVDKFIQVLDSTPNADGGGMAPGNAANPAARGGGLPQKIMQGAMMVSTADRMKQKYDQHAGGKGAEKNAGAKDHHADGSGTRTVLDDTGTSPDDDHNNPPSSEPGRTAGKGTSMTDRQAREEAARLVKGGGITSGKDSNPVRTDKTDGTSPVDDTPARSGMERSFADMGADGKPYDPENTDVIKEAEIKDEEKKIRAKGVTDTASGGVKAGIGAARVAAGDATGAKSIAEGADEASKGVRTMKDKDGAVREAKTRVETGNTDDRSLSGVIAGNTAEEAAGTVKNTVTDKALPGRGKTLETVTGKASPGAGTDPIAGKGALESGDAPAGTVKSPTMNKAATDQNTQTDTPKSKDGAVQKTGNKDLHILNPPKMQTQAPARGQCENGTSSEGGTKRPVSKEVPDKPQTSRKSQTSGKKDRDVPVQKKGNMTSRNPDTTKENRLPVGSQTAQQKDQVAEVRMRMTDMQRRYSMPAYMETPRRTGDNPDAVKKK